MTKDDGDGLRVIREDDVWWKITVLNWTTLGANGWLFGRFQWLAFVVMAVHILHHPFWTTKGLTKRWLQDDIKMYDVIYAQPKPLHSCPHITILVGWIPSVHWGLCPVFTIPQSAAVGYQISPNICVRVQQSLELTPASLDPEHGAHSPARGLAR